MIELVAKPTDTAVATGVLSCVALVDLIGDTAAVEEEEEEEEEVVEEDDKVDVADDAMAAVEVEDEARAAPVDTDNGSETITTDCISLSALSAVKNNNGSTSSCSRNKLTR